MCTSCCGNPLWRSLLLITLKFTSILQGKGVAKSDQGIVPWKFMTVNLLSVNVASTSVKNRLSALFDLHSAAQCSCVIGLEARE
jgi:hypothetical protein